MTSDAFARIVALRPTLLAWYRERGRDLPWRATRDPYAVWVSEIMLQQTRVEAVVPYYARFLDRFPDVAALAASDEDDVLAAWSGLGYYRRARALHRAARIVCERHAGRVPDDPEALGDLPGIGRYTAGAIASIAFGRAEPILDGNVRRVFARLLGPEGDGVPDRVFWDLAAAIADGPDPGDLNQGIMELGATVCTPRSPACDRCPVVSGCAAYALGRPEAWPPPRKRPAPVRVRVGVAVLARGDRILLERPGDDSPFRGTWDLPAVELDGDLDVPARLARALAARHGLAIAAAPLAARARHGILDRDLRLEIHTGRVLRGRVAGRRNVRWIARVDLDRVPVSGATRKVLGALESGD